MARARNIKPSLFKNEILGVADPMITLLFAGLWLLADRAGRLEDRPLRIKGELFPYRDGLDVNSMLDWLAQEDFIVRYSIGGKLFIQVENFAKHQNPHVKEPKSTIPAPDGNGLAPVEHSASTVQAWGDHHTGPADSLSLDSLNLIPDSLQEHVAAGEPPAARDEAKDSKATQSHDQPKKTQGTRLPADWSLPDDWLSWARTDRPEFTSDLLAQEGEKFADYWHSLSGSKAVKLDWLATWRNWIRSARPPANVRPLPQQSRFVNLPQVNAEEIRAKTEENAKLGVSRANF